MIDMGLIINGIRLDFAVSSEFESMIHPRHTSVSGSWTRMFFVCKTRAILTALHTRH
jgi:hypothetical protein